MKFDVELSGPLTQVRKELEEIGRRDARNAGRRALAGAGAIACLGAAFGWGALELPGLIPVRTGLAVLLTVCTIAAIRLRPRNFDPAVIAHLSRLLHQLRQTKSLGEASVKADLAGAVVRRRLEIGLVAPIDALEEFARAASALPHGDLKACSLASGLLKVEFSSSGLSDSSQVGEWVDWFCQRWREGSA